MREAVWRRDSSTYGGRMRGGREGERRENEGGGRGEYAIERDGLTVRRLPCASMHAQHYPGKFLPWLLDN
jgi:hypothetical protein